MKNHYYIEMTDTFGGEANYCWVNRFIVRASIVTPWKTFAEIPLHLLKVE